LGVKVLGQKGKSPYLNLMNTIKIIANTGVRPQPRLGLAGKWLTFENVSLHQLLLNEARILSGGKVIYLA